MKFGERINVVEGLVVARPSKTIKTPYVCDMTINKDMEEIKLGHTPSLGCNGMVDKDASVIAVKRNTGKCEYGVIASIVEEREIERDKSVKYVVGVDPSLAEKFAGEILLNGVIEGLKVESNMLDKQKTYKDCRFDYCGVTKNKEPFVCEVKNVSIAEYENKSPSELKKMKTTKQFEDRPYNSKIAIFPSGYKARGQVHSERALKHVKTLTEIKKNTPIMRCILLFVVQRDDVCMFQPSNGDVIYLDALREAKEVGVEIKAVSIKWVYNKKMRILVPEIDNSKLKVDL